MKVTQVAIGIVALTLFTFPAAAEGDDPSTVLVQLDEPGASLHRLGDGRYAQPICTAPGEVRLPRDGFYYVIDRNKKTKPFTFATSTGERVHVDVHVESVSRAPIGGAILGGTVVFVGVLELATIPMRSDHSCSGSSWFCISPSGWASLIDAFAVVIGTAGTLTSLAFFASSSTKVVAHPTWQPVIDADAHGASLGLRATF
jgi:hypothetical protein